MKRATAYVDAEAFIRLFKVPFNMKLVGVKYPSKGNQLKLTLEGDALPVKESAKNAKHYPKVKYTVLPHWHLAKIVPAEEESENEAKAG